MGCKAYQADSPKYRLKAFYSVLNEQEKQDFEAGELEVVEVAISQRMQETPTLKEEWEQLKHKEAITFFSVEETVHFFYENFYQKMNPEGSDNP